MAKKDQERAKAKELFMNGMQQNDISKVLSVSEKTLTKWAKEGNWQSERAARMFSTDKLKQNKMLLLVSYSDTLLKLTQEKATIESKPDERRTELERNRLMVIQEEIVKISDAASKIDKRGSNVENKASLTLVTYLDVMDDIFNSLQTENPKLYKETLDFQERHIQTIVKKLG